jgi:hypothetical protein
MTDSGLRESLERELRAEAARLGRTLLSENPPTRLEPSYARFRAIQRVLAALTPPRQRSRSLPIVVGSVCAAVVGILFSVRMPSVDTQIDVRASAVRIELADAWEIADEMRPSSIHVDRLDSAEAPGLDVRQQGAGSDLRVDLTGTLLTVTGVRVDPFGSADGSRAVVELESAPGRLRLFARGGRLAATTVAQGSWSLALSDDAALVKVVDNPSEEVGDFAVAVNLKRDRASPVPVEFRIDGGGPFALRGARPHELSFVRERVDRPGEVTRESSIEGGTLRILPSPEPIALEAGDRLELSARETIRFDVTHGDLLTVRFEGSANRLMAGPSGFVRDLRPSVLEWMYRDRRLVFLWGAVGSVWVFLWSLFRSLAG